MTQELWTAVDSYFNGLLLPADSVFEAAQQTADAAGLPPIQVAANQGRLLEILARSIGAQRILEVGTLGGYSTIWLARALPANGSLITLELEQKHADVARANVARAGFADKVEVRVGPAMESLAKLANEGRQPFDFVFIDADKANTPGYFEWALKMTRRGGVIITDNVVRNGKVADLNTDDPNMQGIQKFVSAMSTDPRIISTAIQTVGSKGYDGFAIALVVGE